MYPRSAIIESQGSTSSEVVNNSLSEIHPLYSLDTLETALDEVTQMSAFKVL